MGAMWEVVGSEMGGVMDLLETDECIILAPDKAVEPVPSTLM